MAMARHHIHFTDESWERIEDEARRHGMNASEWVRLAADMLTTISRLERGIEPEKSMRDLVREVRKQSG